MKGIEGAFAGIGQMILDNLGNLLIMAGLAATPIGWPMVIAGLGLQLASGIVGGLGTKVSPEAAIKSTPALHNIKFNIDGRDLVGVIDRNNEYDSIR